MAQSRQSTTAPCQSGSPFEQPSSAIRATSSFRAICKQFANPIVQLQLPVVVVAVVVAAVAVACSRVGERSQELGLGSLPAPWAR
jgi:hypothetical protein